MTPRDLLAAFGAISLLILAITLILRGIVLIVEQRRAKRAPGVLVGHIHGRFAPAIQFPPAADLRGASLTQRLPRGWVPTEPVIDVQEVA